MLREILCILAGAAADFVPAEIHLLAAASDWTQSANQERSPTRVLWLRAAGSHLHWSKKRDII